MIKPDHFRNKIVFYCRKNATKDKKQRNYKCVKCAAIAANNFMPLNFYAFDYEHTRIRINFWPSVLCCQHTLLDEVYDHHQFTIRVPQMRDVSDAMRVIHQGQCLDHRQAYRAIHMWILFLIQCITNSHTHARTQFSCRKYRNFWSQNPITSVRWNNILYSNILGIRCHRRVFFSNAIINQRRFHLS